MSIVTHAVPFRGTEITAIETEAGEVFVAIKPICEHLGIADRVQRRKIMSDPRRWGGTIRSYLSASGDQETVCIPFNRLAMWLATINANKVKPAVRHLVEAYQAEAADVLDRHFRVQRDALRVAQEQMLIGNPYLNRIARFHGLGMTKGQVHKLVGRSREIFEINWATLQMCGILPGEPVRAPVQEPLPLEAATANAG